MTSYLQVEVVALPDRPSVLIESPEADEGALPALLLTALRRVRITESMQYCFMPAGDWTTDARPAPFKPKDAIGFHVLVGGTCWLEVDGARSALRQGDIALFPFGTPHALGAGANGPVIDPGRELPPPPWRETPILDFGGEERVVRVLCGYVRCEAMYFAPFRNSLPEMILVSTAGGGDWLAGIIAQIVVEVDAPREGGSAMLERLTEIVLLEVLRRQLLRQPDDLAGWLGAIRDPVVGRCLRAFHSDPHRPWTLRDLVKTVGASRSVIVDRFAVTLGDSPMNYLRAWRLFLARERLREVETSIATIAFEAGYASEAAFSRAFARANGSPPAAYRARHAGARP